MSVALRFITEPRLSGYFFAAALFLVYGLAPLAIYGLFDRNPFMLQLGVMCSVAAVTVVAAFNVPIFDGLMKDHRFRIGINEKLFQFVVWGVFSIFFIVTLVTAPKVPLFSALFGTFSADELNLQRGSFLKTREGWESSLGYIGGIFSGTLLPLAMAMLFLNVEKLRYVALGGFVFYTLSYLQKALFIQVVSPLIYLSSRRLIWNYIGLLLIVVGSIGILYLNTILARGIQEDVHIEEILAKREQRREEMDATGPRARAGRSSEADSTRPPGQDLVPPDFFTARFLPTSTVEHLTWRIVAVPIFTASDALLVFDRNFDGHYMYGATSSLLAAILGLDRVNYDAEVYAHQWGRTGIGHSNSVFVTDGYVNFGWPGIIIFSALVGFGFRALSKSSNEAIRSMWPLFAYNVIQASLIGTLLSVGFSLLFFIALFVKFTDGAKIQKNYD